MRNAKPTSPGKENEIKTRQLRCLYSRRSTRQRRLPSILLDGVWLKNAGFEAGDWAHIVVMDGVLVIRCEKNESSPEE
ncbi:SymE family type I addiction module toxin [Parabacteroides pacaensis]|uniref:SymE family type I addiction module toxin n=1 Tax=Parabacteroides pacaensis TaxID=2086575 RepID=UPI000D0F0ECB|nr:SymE family type I addiction module toxin [Parabacteroides pacaensis]